MLVQLSCRLLIILHTLAMPGLGSCLRLRWNGIGIGIEAESLSPSRLRCWLAINNGHPFYLWPRQQTPLFSLLCVGVGPGSHGMMVPDAETPLDVPVWMMSKFWTPSCSTESVSRNVL